MRRYRRLASVGLAWLALGGCASVAVQQDGTVSYRYSSFDFSGDSWARQKQRCEALSLTPRHLDTTCGFWTCTSRYVCESPDRPSAQSSVAQ